jgi:hypothetical protein
MVSSNCDPAIWEADMRRIMIEKPVRARKIV